MTDKYMKTIVATFSLLIIVGAIYFVFNNQSGNTNSDFNGSALEEKKLQSIEPSNTLDMNVFLRGEETILSKKEADFDGDGIGEWAFVSFYNQKETDGSIRPYDFDARVGVLDFNQQEKSWKLVFEDITEAVYESTSGEGIVEMFEVTDFNQDNRMELLVSTRFGGTGGYRTWFLVASIDGQLQPMKRNLPNGFYEEHGFEGHNRIDIIGDLIHEEFPIYLSGDSNCCPGGGYQDLYFRFDGSRLILEKSETRK